METKVHACINSDNIVVNVVLWDGESEWTPPEGYTLVDVTGIDCGIGDLYENETFTKPVENELLQNDDQELQSMLENE